MILKENIIINIMIVLLLLYDNLIILIMFYDNIILKESASFPELILEIQL